VISANEQQQSKENKENNLSSNTLANPQAKVKVRLCFFPSQTIGITLLQRMSVVATPAIPPQ
jgi:sulfur relay (sulfurtransferase) complex TusBCD TusD component (DsrE family)